uniref:Myosin XVIIIB n=1 Tax=Naja naja TaxID=35670 RepID=A0A8C6XLM2_NAJNA
HSAFVPLQQVSEDVWFETEKVWLVQKDQFALATELKPDVGTLELPPGTVRVRLDADGSIVEVDEEEVQKANPPSLDYTEDLAALVSLNEASVLHVLRQRCQSQLPYTFSGPHLVALRTHRPIFSQAFQGRRDRMSPHIFAVAQRAYWGMLAQRQDQTIMALGRSNTGKTTACQNILEYLVATAGSCFGFAVEKIQAVFTVLRAFGTVSAGPNRTSTRFSMVLALDFTASGHVTAAHLQTMLLERARVAQQPEGEGTFNIFSQMLAGLGLDQRLLGDSGLSSFLQGEEKREASAAFAQLQAALGTLGVEAAEQEALWRVLAGIYHLGAAGVCKVGRKQFLKFEWANRAADVLGCEAEELSTAVFKHHLQRILQQVTAGARSEEPLDGPKLSGVECLEGMAAGLYEELFAAVVMLVNRSFSSSQLSTASLMVVDTPGFLSPRHQKRERAATFEEFCHNYGQERLQGLFYKASLESEVGRYQEVRRPPCSFAPRRVSQAGGVGSPDPQGLLWILDEEALMQGSSDSRALDRLCSAFGKEGKAGGESLGNASCIGKGNGLFPSSKAAGLSLCPTKGRMLQSGQLWGLSVFLPRAQVPLLCRSVAGWEGHSQQALKRTGCLRKTFSGSFATIRRRSVCAQIKLQLDALSNLVKRSQIHFLHCLDPGTPEAPRLPTEASEAAPGPAWDVPALRAQLSGSLILEALRLHRIGYADRMELTQFRRRFQGLAQLEMKKFTSAYELPDEKKALEELLRALDLEKKSVALGHTQVFLKAGVLPRLEKQREKLVSQSLAPLQAACRGFLSRQRFKKWKIQSLAARCIQKNLAVYRAVKSWPWWQLMCGVRPLLTISLAESQLQVKEVPELLGGPWRRLPPTTCFCSALDAERAERLRHEGKSCRCLRAGVLMGAGRLPAVFIPGVWLHDEPWSGMGWALHGGLPALQLSQAQQLYEEARRSAQQLKRKCQQLTCELEDTRVLMENQQSRNHELEKKQKKSVWGAPPPQEPLGSFSKAAIDAPRMLIGLNEAGGHQKELENEGLGQRVTTLSCQVQELSNSASLDTPAALQKKLWDLESRTREQQQELSQQARAVEQLEQLHLRLDLEIERTKQIHQKRLEDKEEELEDTRKSCQKRLRQLEMQCEQECDEKQSLLREKRDLEGLVATLCEQIGHRDFDVEKRLRRDLKRTHALLADVQLLLETSGADPGPPGNQEEWAQLRRQWEESAARCAEAQESQKVLSLEVENLHSELETATRNKHLVDEQLYQLQHEKADLLKRFQEDQEDLNELMVKHKALIAQSATDIAQIRELQGQLEELKKEKQALQERLQAAQARLAYLEQAMVERSIVSRQEALICDLESKMEFQSVQIKRFEVLVLRLRDSVVRMGEELEKAKESEARERENVHYYRLRLEEMKADRSELAQRELEASRRRVDLRRNTSVVVCACYALQFGSWAAFFGADGAGCPGLPRKAPAGELEGPSCPASWGLFYPVQERHSSYSECSWQRTSQGCVEET